jgi:AcrR family transcriptional regulator
MPRHIDPEVEERILQAALRLWHRGGEKALSMRAVAKAARTNTPAVYRRFRNRDEILGALVRYYQRELFRAIEPSKSIQDFAQRYFDFALDRPREYELMMSGLLARMSKDRPNFEFLMQRSAEWLGGSPREHRYLGLALFCLAHGAVTLKISGNVREDNFPRVDAAFATAVDVLVANEGKFRSND